MRLKGEEKGVRVLFIIDKDILKILCGKLTLSNIPEDATPLEVHHNHLRRGFDILVEHESFKPVDLGLESPSLIAEYHETNRNGKRSLSF